MNSHTNPPCTLAIGNFDGVHAGHQRLIRVALQHATKNNLPLHILTFTPHPRTVLRPQQTHTQLMTDSQKEAALTALGATKIHFLPFTATLANLTPTAFETDILIHQLNAQHVVIGANFNYGHKAQGTPQTLQQNPHFTTHIVPLLVDEHGPLSSTRLRQNNAP